MWDSSHQIQTISALTQILIATISALIQFPIARKKYSWNLRRKERNHGDHQSGIKASRHHQSKKSTRSRQNTRI